jgi:hypothetical protein|tara:strand:- start:2518 stop:2676 length:159 start_codon:yes stop_codon:yes gene_type:complete
MKFGNEELIDELHRICGMIYYQVPLKHQDRWLKSMIDKGIWKPNLEEEDRLE